MKRKRPSGAADSPYDTFLSSFRRVSSRLGPCQEAIASLLEPDSAFEPPRFVPGGPEITFSRDRGLLKIRNLLPEDVALALLDILEALPEERWRPTAAPDDPSRNNVSHRFSSVKHDGTISALSPAFKVLEFLAPPDPAGDGEERMPCTLSAARYIGGDHIVPHDDRAFHDVLIDGAPVQHSRSVAMILHLTRNWDASFGGGLVDLEDPEAEGGRRYVPEFNSLVAFRVPRWHVVEEVKEGRTRYSLFGWALTEGKSYELELGGGNGEGAVKAGRNEEHADEALLDGEERPVKPRSKRRRRQQWIVRDLV